MTYDRAVASLKNEIRMLGGRNARLTHNPYNRGSDPTDAGVAVYFDLKGTGKVFACDRWDKVRDNVRALSLTIDAMRGLERWGASDLIERAFTGFDALPPPPPPPSCWQVLDLPPTATRDEIERAYRAKAKSAHPDTGGSTAAMAELNRARTEALTAIEGHR